MVGRNNTREKREENLERVGEIIIQEKMNLQGFMIHTLRQGFMILILHEVVMIETKKREVDLILKIENVFRTLHKKRTITEMIEGIRIGLKDTMLTKMADMASGMKESVTDKKVQEEDSIGTEEMTTSIQVHVLKIIRCNPTIVRKPISTITKVKDLLPL